MPRVRNYFILFLCLYSLSFLCITIGILYLLLSWFLDVNVTHILVAIIMNAESVNFYHIAYFVNTTEWGSTLEATAYIQSNPSITVTHGTGPK